MLRWPAGGPAATTTSGAPETAPNTPTFSFYGTDYRSAYVVFRPYEVQSDILGPSGYLPLSALARADGWILIEADSEGFAEGTRVAVWPWP